MTGDPAQARPEVQAVIRRATAIVNEILQGDIDPYPGAKQLWLMHTELSALTAELRPFVRLASEWEDAPAQREFYEGDIIAAADAFRARRA
jgi:hypothetical protein